MGVKIMMLGHDRILACPICHAAARVGTLLSGNTFGAILFTDGKMIAPMLHEMPALARCKGCGVFYWLSDAEEVGATSGGPDASSVDPDACARAQRVEMLSEADYAEALAAGLASDRERELYLRVRLWWAANDRNRRARGTPPLDGRRIWRRTWNGSTSCSTRPTPMSGSSRPRSPGRPATSTRPPGSSTTPSRRSARTPPRRSAGLRPSRCPSSG